VAEKARKGAKKPLPDLIRRQRAINATMLRFGGKVLKGGAIGGRTFKLGKTDCIHMLRAHLVAMGHRGLPKLPRYSSPGGATAALKSALRQSGADEDGTLEHLLDALLPRIAPAAMLPGDVALVEAEPHAPAWRAGSVVVSLGRKWLGWHADSPVLAVQEPLVDRPYIGAWRC
jgi:hypothetical protein